MESKSSRPRRALRAPLAAAALASLLPSSLFAQPVEHVFHISVDGLRGDLLKALVADSPATYPNYLRLQNEGSFTYHARTDFDYTETIPNHLSMVTGRPAIRPLFTNDETIHHGYTSNFPFPNDNVQTHGNPAVPYKSSTFDVVHDNGLRTALYVGKDKLGLLDRSWNATNGAADVIGDDNGRDKIDQRLVDNGDTPGLLDRMLTEIAPTAPNYTFFHIVDPDTAGHGGFWGTPFWNASVAGTDAYIGRIFEFIQTNDAFRDKTAIVLTADHGGGGDPDAANNHIYPLAYENYNIPMFIWGAGFGAGDDLYSYFLNRVNPGDGRPHSSDPSQPIRNGDTANIALHILGLPPVPGSHIRPQFGLLVAEGATRAVDNLRVETAQINGTVTVNSTGNGDVSDPAGTSVITNLSLGPAGRLDLANNALILHNSTLDSVRAALRTGRNAPPGTANGRWDGATGVTSSAAAERFLQANTENRSLGYALNSDLPLGAYTTFAGQSVFPTDILVRYTRNGDATLNGVVDDNDVSIVGGFYQSIHPADINGPMHWYQGDFNFDGYVDDTDVTMLGGFYEPGASPLTAESRLAGIPEPSLLALLPLTLLMRRKARIH